MATGWGRKTWGASEWGDLSDEIVSVSGISLTSSIGSESVTANADVSVSGISLSSSQGTTVAGSSVLIEDPGPVTMSSGIGAQLSELECLSQDQFSILKLVLRLLTRVF